MQGIRRKLNASRIIASAYSPLAAISLKRHFILFLLSSKDCGYVFTKGPEAWAKLPEKVRFTLLYKH